jgi:hypothetical protein
MVRERHLRCRQTCPQVVGHRLRLMTLQANIPASHKEAAAQLYCKGETDLPVNIAQKCYLARTW